MARGSRISPLVMRAPAKRPGHSQTMCVLLELFNKTVRLPKQKQ